MISVQHKKIEPALSDRLERTLAMPFDTAEAVS
jgi:hypothetical protein